MIRPSLQVTPLLYSGFNLRTTTSFLRMFRCGSEPGNIAFQMSVFGTIQYKQLGLLNETPAA